MEKFTKEEKQLQTILLSISDIQKYKQYTKVNIKGKNGVTKPITRVVYIKQCPDCGGDMNIELVKSLKKFVRNFIRWKCIDKKCKYQEREESFDEYLERLHYKPKE